MSAPRYGTVTSSTSGGYASGWEKMATDLRPTQISTIRRVAFTVVVAAFTVVTALLTPLPYLILGWFVEVGPGELSHKVHEISFGALFLLPFGGLVCQLRKPERKVAPMYQVVVPLVIAVAVLVFVGEADPTMVIFVAFPIVVFSLHPARSELLRPRLAPSAVLLGLALAATLPLLVFAWDELGTAVRAAEIAPSVFDSLPENATDAQVERAIRGAVGPGDARQIVEHFGHWSAMAAFALSISAMAIIAALRPAGWRTTAWTVAPVTALYGVASLIYPADASAHGGLWGVAAIAWGVLFSAAAARERAADETAPEPGVARLTA